MLPRYRKRGDLQSRVRIKRGCFFHGKEKHFRFCRVAVLTKKGRFAGDKKGKKSRRRGHARNRYSVRMAVRGKKRSVCRRSRCGNERLVRHGPDSKASLPGRHCGRRKRMFRPIPLPRRRTKGTGKERAPTAKQKTGCSVFSYSFPLSDSFSILPFLSYHIFRQNARRFLILGMNGV